jgi:hypothetical protein
MSIALLVPAAVSAAPITYEINWSLDFADEGPYWGTYSSDPLGAPSTTVFTFDSTNNLFGGFVVDWWGMTFDFGSLLNDLASDDRELVAAALLTPDNNTWQGITRSHDSPTFQLGLDAVGLSPFAFFYPDGQPSLWGSSASLNDHLPLEITSPECGELPAGCVALGTYSTHQAARRKVPEPATYLLIALGSSAVLSLREREKQKRRS